MLQVSPVALPMTALAPAGGDGGAGTPVTVVALPGRRAAEGRPQGRP
jgi:hypothetical protein